MRVNKLTTLSLLLFAVIPVSALQAESLDGWYQVDVILFKPTSTDLDAESWPVFEPTYPADVVAVSEPRAFNLSQLEQAEPASIEADQAPLEPALSRDEFLFQDEGFSQRNRRMIESITGVRDSRTNGREMDDATTDQEADDGEPETAELEQAEPVPLPEADPLGPGTLAFSRTTENSTLNSILRSLNRSSRFKILSHDSWLQPINAEPTPIMIQTGQRFDDRYEVEGTLSFYRSRYLHIQTDLWYTRFEPRGGDASPFLGSVASELSDEMLKHYADLVEVERERGLYYPARVHRMIQSRRMRSSELHYLDHPLMGIIVQISRFEPEIVGSE